MGAAGMTYHSTKLAVPDYGVTREDDAGLMKGSKVFVDLDKAVAYAEHMANTYGVACVVKERLRGKMRIVHWTG